MIAITSALLTASVLGALFDSTRWIGLVCLALLAALFPFTSLAILLLAGVIFIFTCFH